MNLSIDDISRVSVLFEHAKYHQETYGDSFLEFLVDHYSSDNNHDAIEHEEHEDLPFKHGQQTFTHISSVFVLIELSFGIKEVECVDIPFNFFYRDSHSFFEKPSIFQPPKQI